MAWLAAELEITVASAEPGAKPSTAAHTVRASSSSTPRRAGRSWRRPSLRCVPSSSSASRSGRSRRRRAGGRYNHAVRAIEVPISKPNWASSAWPPRKASGRTGRSGGARSPRIPSSSSAPTRASGHRPGRGEGAAREVAEALARDRGRGQGPRSSYGGLGLRHGRREHPEAGRAPYRMSAFLVAVPGPNRTWSVVAAA